VPLLAIGILGIAFVLGLGAAFAFRDPWLRWALIGAPCAAWAAYLFLARNHYGWHAGSASARDVGVIFLGVVLALWLAGLLLGTAVSLVVRRRRT
jgi:hypothetical protein